MFDQNQSILRRAERIAETGDVNETLAELRNLCLFDFGHLLLTMPHAAWPHLSRILPRMASEEVQNSWTGESGARLLATSTNFVSIVNSHLTDLCHRSLKRSRILDYGCGYGRIMRLMYYYSDPANIYGVDPWDKSIEICKQDGVLGNILLSEYLPIILPVPDNNFDLVYCYSVFTHTSLKATQHALSALRKCIAPSGLLVLTTRPVEYWGVESLKSRSDFDMDRYITKHRETGFAFLPSSWNMPADGESIFGDTSIDPEWIGRNFPDWTVRAYDRGLDHYQVIIFLTPR